MKNDIKVAVIGKKGSGETSLVKRIAKNAVSIGSIDVGYIIKDGRRIYLFGATGDDREVLYRELAEIGIDLAIVVIDPIQGITEEDYEILEELESFKLPHILFVNKIDDAEHIPEINAEKEPIYGSAIKGWGIEKAIDCIVSAAYLKNS